MRRSRRLGAVVVAGAALSGALAAPAAAHDDDDHDRNGGGRNKTVVVTHTPKTWTMTSDTCSQLPSGTTITGSGILRVKVTTYTAANGILTEVWDERADGRAVDQNGNRYRWKYKNDSIETNSLGSPQLFTGPMTDTFEMEGKGPIEVEAGFEANVVDDRAAGTFVINPVPGTPYGDPADFGPEFKNRCDPL